MFRPEIKLVEKTSLKNCTLIEGFPGIGLVVLVTGLIIFAYKQWKRR